MNALVDLQRDGAIAIVAVDSPPVNALKQAVRAGVADAMKAAEAGNPDAQFLAGQMLTQGTAVPQDVARGVALLERAASAGNIAAMVAAGTIYAYGEGIAPDYTKAFRLLKPAAEAGDAHAQNNLAVLYHFGLGTAADPVQALAWVLRAERLGVLQALRLRAEIEAGMTLAQKAEAQKLSNQPLPEPAPAIVVTAPASQTPPAPPTLSATATPSLSSPPAPPAAEAGPIPSGKEEGTWAVQVASLPSAEEARKSWAATLRKAGNLLSGEQPSYVAVDLGAKGRFTRVLVGHFADRAAANALCAKLIRSGVDCLPRKR